jgi:hypothetical protein
MKPIVVVFGNLETDEWEFAAQGLPDDSLYLVIDDMASPSQRKLLGQAEVLAQDEEFIRDLREFQRLMEEYEGEI